MGGKCRFYILFPMSPLKILKWKRKPTFPYEIKDDAMCSVLNISDCNFTEASFCKTVWSTGNWMFHHADRL